MDSDVNYMYEQIRKKTVVERGKINRMVLEEAQKFISITKQKKSNEDKLQVILKWMDKRRSD